MNANVGNRSGSGANSVRHQMSEQEGKEARPRMRSAHTVLVVDDHETLRYATAKLLGLAGFKTIEAGSGEEALLSSVRATAVVLDVNLPDINGIQVLKMIRDQVKGMPVVLTSAVFVDELHRHAGMDAGADAYLIAPVSPEELTSTLDRVLGTAPA